MNRRDFYDIHCHAMNFSHPNLFAFLKRKLTIVIMASPLAPVAKFFFRTKFNRVINLFSLMENDIADFFLIMEYYLKKMLQGSPIKIGDTIYDKIILTPLMMDFGYKGIKGGIFYDVAPQKPIVEQVVDIFNGIKKYSENELIVKSDGMIGYTAAQKDNKLFEIYPFLGINTKNYTYKEVENLLVKYFSDYNCDRKSLYENMGKFNGNIDETGSNFFAGIKVYPPLGFDPWPAANSSEFAKVKCLYHYCCEKKIPITTHCSEGGFSIDKNAEENSSPKRWKHVLKKSEFKDMKINFAHFGRQDKTFGIIPKKEWENTILELIGTNENVYADFSYRGVDEKYYLYLNNLIDKQSDHAFKKKLRQRILFGSDFMINLLDVDSYNDYLRQFAEVTGSVSDEDKNLFCSSNPEDFLFGKRQTG